MDKLKFFIKNNPVPIIISIILIALYVYHEDSFFIVLLSYGLFIYFLTSKYNKGKIKYYLRIVIWTTFIIFLGLSFYESYLPHGPRYPTGDYICEGPDNNMGRCRPEYYEDMRELDIPDWAKFLRKNFAGLLFCILFAGLFTRKAEDDEEK